MKRLYRSRKNHIVGGVCGGLGDYFELDPVLIRLVWLIMILFGGIGILLYFIAWIIIPADVTSVVAKPEEIDHDSSTRGRFWWGLVLMLMGIFIWGSQYRLIYWPVIPGVQVQSRDLVPIGLMLVGVYILYTFARSAASQIGHSGKSLARSTVDKKLAGVCGGIAEYFAVDSTLVRIIWVAGAFFYGSAILLYMIFVLAIPVKSLADETPPVKKKASR
ncbi:PspC domain-containing protein [Candidatus Neomarinimicrobiota bacterium]